MTALAIIVTVTFLVSAMCSLFEATLYSTRMAVLESAAAKGRHMKVARRMLALKKNIAAPTAAILILNTIANTAGAALTGMVASQIWGSVGMVAVSVGLTLGILFLAEILPKTFGAVHWRTIWPYVVDPLVWMRRLLYPMIRITTRFSDFFTGATTVPLVTEDEIQATIHMGRQEGEVTQEEQQLISAVFRFDDMVVRQIMVPRREVVILKKEWPIEEWMKIIREHGHTRYPVCVDSLDDAIGLLHIKDLALQDPSEIVEVEALLRPLPTIPTTMRIGKLLRQMQRTRKHMAIAVDERGTALGVVTMENILEQIIGAVHDEFDTETLPDIMPEGKGDFIVQGHVTIDQLNDTLHLDLYAPDVDTISGLLVSKAGRMLKPGDEIELDGLSARVLEIRSDHATRVRIRTIHTAHPNSLDKAEKESSSGKPG